MTTFGPTGSRGGAAAPAPRVSSPRADTMTTAAADLPAPAADLAAHILERSQGALLLGGTVPTVRNWTRRGLTPPPRHIGNKRFWRVADLAELLTGDVATGRPG